MRASVLAAAVFSSTVVLGQGLLGQIPKCAQTCFGNNLGTCGPIDIGCICGNATLINSVSCCVFATCNSAEINQTITFATQLCSANNVQVNTNPTCGNASNSSTNATASTSGKPSVTGVTGSRTAAPSSTNAAIQTAAGSLGLGVAMAGLLAFL